MNHRHQEKKDQRNLLAKENLINNTKSKIFCKIGVSDISGVGVIAIKDIPKGTKIFECCNEELLGLDTPIEVNKNDLGEVEDSVLEYIDNFIVQREPDVYPLPFRGFNSINIIYYLNHSIKPNVEFCLDGEPDEFVAFVTSKEIKKGEEITQDYNNLSYNKKELLKQFSFLNKK